MLFPNLKLISFTMCPYVRRARIVLLEKNIPCEIEYIDLEAPPPWFYDVSPLEKVPVLLVDDQPVFESLVICDYLDEISPGSLYPDNALLKAQQRAWMVFGDTILDTVYAFIAAREESAFKQHKASILDRLEMLEEAIVDGRLFGHETAGMLDISLAPMLHFLYALKRTAAQDFFAETPSLLRWTERFLQRSSVANSVPAGFDDDLPNYLKRAGSMLAGHFKSQ